MIKKAMAVPKFLFGKPDVHFGEISFLFTTKAKTYMIMGVRFRWELGEWQINAAGAWHLASEELEARNSIDA